MRGEEDQNRHDSADQHIVAVSHPEDRHIEDEITKGPSANAGDAGQEQEPDNVELLTRSRQRPGRRKNGDAGIVEKGDGMHE